MTDLDLGVSECGRGHKPESSSCARRCMPLMQEEVGHRRYAAAAPFGDQEGALRACDI